jgi:hypothetical protein
MTPEQIQELIESEFRKYGHDADINFAKTASLKIHSNLKATSKNKIELLNYIYEEHKLTLTHKNIADILIILNKPQ